MSKITRHDFLQRFTPTRTEELLSRPSVSAEQAAALTRADLDSDGVVGNSRAEAVAAWRAVDSFDRDGSAATVDSARGTGAALADALIGPSQLPFEAEALRHNGPEFVDKLRAVAERLGVKPEWLMRVMHYESGFDPAATNRRGGATGLIQFMPRTARGLGTTTDELSRMTGAQQLDYVERFFSQFPRGAFRSGADLYLANFWPSAVGKPDDYVLGASPGRARQVAEANPGSDVNHDGQVTAGEFRARNRARFGE